MQNAYLSQPLIAVALKDLFSPQAADMMFVVTIVKPL